MDEPETGLRPDRNNVPAAVAHAMIEHELDPFDSTEQQSRAILQLLRCLTIGKAIAVVGSGTSVVYGYETWDGLVSRLCLYLAKSVIDEDLNDKSRENFRLLKSIVEADNAKRDDLNRNKETDPEAKDHSLLDKDERLAICDELSNCLNDSGRKKLEAHIASEFTRSSRYRYTLGSIQKNHPLHRKVARILKKLPGLKGKDKHKAFISPDVAGLLESLPITQKIFEKNAQSRAPDQENDGNCSEFNDQNHIRDAPRNQVDPLLELRHRFGIHRFATFNYDLEIEALLEALDYPYDDLTRIPHFGQDRDQHASGERVKTSQSRIGGIAHSISLSAENAPDLISLAAIPSSANDLVVHVHGSITHPHDMVVTQSRYNEIYYENHPYRKGFEDARNLLFGGNAVIYIGVGLSEEDLMRPLRYLSANLRNRPLFALIPLKKSEEQARAFELRIKSNFGVNVITYGRAWKNIPNVWRRYNPTHPTGIDFISLSEELAHIRNAFAPRKSDADDSSRYRDAILHGMLFLSDEEHRAECPRFRRALPLASIIAGIVHREIANGAIEVSASKLEKFLERLESLITSIALNHALEFMQGVATGWQSALKLSRSSGGLSIRDHYGSIRIRDADKLAISPQVPERLFAMDEERVLEAIRGLPEEGGVRIVHFEPGQGKGTFFWHIRRISRRPEYRSLRWRAVSLDHTVRGTSVLAHVLDEIDSTDLLCLQNADCLLDLGRGQPATLFIHNFISALKDRCDRNHRNSTGRKNAKRKRPLALILVAKSTRAFGTYHKYFFGESKEVSFNKPIHRASDPYDARLDGHEHLIEAARSSRWSALALMGTRRNLETLPGADRFFANCDLALHDRAFSIDKKHLQAALCEVLLDERHRLIMNSMDMGRRDMVVLENIILKWMYSIYIPIDLSTIRAIPELDDFFTKRHRRMKSKHGAPHERKLSGEIESAIRYLKDYRFIFEIEYQSQTRSKERRYILHGAVRQLLGHRRGFSLDPPQFRDNNPINLCLMLMDGGPMLSSEDFGESCRLFDKLLSLPKIEKNRVPLRSAYALMRGSLHTQSAMRAGLEAFDKPSALHAHLRRLTRLRSACRAYPSDEKTPGKSVRPVMYIHDDLWLINEIGVVRYIQGNFHDATFAFREALDAIDRVEISVNPKTRKTLSGSDPSLKTRISINLALCLIERARFHDASTLVDKAIDALVTMPAPGEASSSDRFHPGNNPENMLLHALLLGCRAQIQLLTAQLDPARKTVEQALPIVESLDALGAQAWLHAVQASAALACKDHVNADAAIALALEAARGSHRPDLILSLELAAIDLKLKSCAYDREMVLSSLTRLEHLESDAQRLGSHKYRVGTMLIRARSLLTIEQLEPARESIVEAISIAQLNGMRLKRISGLILLVALMAQRGEIVPARRLLKPVKLAATRARYVGAIADIERLEQAIDIDGAIPRWAGYVSDAN